MASWRERLRHIGVGAALLLASCATPPAAPRNDAMLAARVDAALAERGAGTDLLQLVDNMLRHEPGPPPAAPRLVRALLAQPLAAADAEAIFRHAVPAELLAFDERAATAAPATLDELLAT